MREREARAAAVLFPASRASNLRMSEHCARARIRTLRSAPPLGAPALPLTARAGAGLPQVPTPVRGVARCLGRRRRLPCGGSDLGEREALPYIRCPGCALDSYSAAGHSTTDHCPRCGAPLSGGVQWERLDGVLVQRMWRTARRDETESAPPDAPAAPVT